MNEVTASPRAALERLDKAQRILIVSHRSPDGDAIGSALALDELASLLGIEAAVISRDPHPANLGFLPRIERIQIVSAVPVDLAERFDLVVVLECPGLDRPGFDGLDRLPILNIDHHLANDAYGEVNVVDPDAPALGEMILAMVEAAGVALTPSMATNLYTALVTDTGDFRYSNATPRAFSAAARLVDAGARPAKIANALWDHTPARVLRLTAAVLSTLELAADGAIATMSCDTAMLQRVGARPEDTENLIDYARRIEGVEVAVVFKTFVAGSVRISLRSRGTVDVQKVAVSFGGGGHRNAAGCTLTGTIEEARQTLRAALEPALEGV